MKTKISWILTVMMLSSLSIVAQDNWEPEKNITGYLVTQFDYFDGLKGYSRDHAFNLSEGGLLASFKPRKKLELKTVFVYRPQFSIDQMLNEISGQYSFSDYFKIKGGRFLLPISPMNAYYYAPVNNSVSLPMTIANHEYFPLNINGLMIGGSIGNDLKLKYDVFMGSYFNSANLNTGAIGFFGNERTYFDNVVNDGDTRSILSDTNDNIHEGKGAHLSCSYLDNLTLGFGVFKGSESTNFIIEESEGATYTFDIKQKRLVYGSHLKFIHNSFKIIGEYWKSNFEYTILQKLNIPKSEINYESVFVEMSNSIGQVTPYVRCEIHKEDEQDIDRYTVGINYKPFFETTIKLEYMNYQFKNENDKKTDLNGLVASFIYAF